MNCVRTIQLAITATIFTAFATVSTAFAEKGAESLSYESRRAAQTAENRAVASDSSDTVSSDSTVESSGQMLQMDRAQKR